FFFFQAEDGIRDGHVTGVQTCALPISKRLGGGWGWIGLFLVLFHFAVPFAILLSRPFKRDVTKLVWLAMWLMLMRYLDLFWVIRSEERRVGKECRSRWGR